MSENQPLEKSVEQSQAAPKGAGRFLRFSLIYVLGDLLAKGARIVLTPFYVSVLTKAEIGELAVLQAIIICSWTLLGFGFHFAVHKYYHEYGERGDSLVSSLWLARIIVALPFYGLLLLAGYGFHSVSGGSISLPLILLAITAGYLRGGINIVEFWLNIREEPVKYRAFTFCQFLLTTILILYLVLAQGMGVMGVVLGELISYSVFVFISAFMLFRKSVVNFKAVNWKQIFKYCSPVLPHSFFMWGLMGADKLILNMYVPKAEIGIYSIGFLLGSFLSIVGGSMRAAWLPAYFKNASAADSAQQFGKIASIFLFLICFTALFGMYFAAETVWLFSITADVSYAESAKVMQCVLFGFVSMSLFIALNQPLLYERRTGLLSTISGLGLATNVLINLWLIPRIGIWGAVTANVASYLLMAAVTFAVSNRIYKVTWETAALRLTSASFILFGGIAYLFPAETVIWVVPVKILLVILFPLITLFRIRFSNDSILRLESRYAWTKLPRKRTKSPLPNQ